MANRTITALFDSRAEAEQAVQALVSEVGLDRSAVRVDLSSEAATTTGAAASSHEDRGFFASLKDLFVPDEDRHAYAEGMRRGGVLVSAQVDDARIDRAMDVLEQHGAVDLDEREAAWRREGWTGYSGAAAAGAGTGAVVGASSDGNRTGIAAMPGTGTAAPDGTPGNPPGTMLSRGVDQVAGTNVSGAHPEHEARGTAGVAGTTTTGAATTSAAQTGGAEAIPITEERLTVGKREVNRGRVRVRSYVVETPVQEQVALRQEHVDVERRPVDRPVAAGDDAFRERTVEATESAEEAVVAKEAQVKEELVIRKTAEEQTQTVQDTVRRTEVEVEDERQAGTSTGGTTTTGTPRTPERGPGAA
jgi:uncharacterized protein (TIGR02271 family)